jgi:hypothetical protein
MKFKNLIWFAFIGLFISGLLFFMLFHGDGQPSSSRLSRQAPIFVSDTYLVASLSKGTILLLLAVGVTGALGISRTKKGIRNPFQRNAADSPSDHENETKDGKQLIPKNS